MTQTDRDTQHVLDQKNQYHQNGFTTQNNLQIQWNSYQITYGIFHRTGKKKKKKPTICMKEASNIQSNIEKEKWSWRNQIP